MSFIARNHFCRDVEIAEPCKESGGNYFVRPEYGRREQWIIERCNDAVSEFMIMEHSPPAGYPAYDIEAEPLTSTGIDSGL